LHDVRRKSSAKSCPNRHLKLEAVAAVHLADGFVREMAAAGDSASHELTPGSGRDIIMLALQAPNELPNLWYATVYPASMVAKILLAQIIVSLFLS
jgi:hypothetical protein